MKIKDKISGEVYEAETWKSWNGAVKYVKKGTNGPIRSSDDVEIIEEEKPKDTTDWDAFRREAAKDILVAMTRKVVDDPDQLDAFEPAFYAKVAVEWADQLIKELKQN